MSGNEVEGGIGEGIGKVKDAVGGLTGDASLQGEGKIDQLTGRAQRQFGDTVDDTVGGAQDQLEVVTELVSDHPLTALGIATLFGFLLGWLLIPSRKG